MSSLVAVSGIVITAVGIAGVIQPQGLVTVILRWRPQTRFVATLVVRFVLGPVLLLGAAESRFPAFVFTVGILALVSAVVGLVLGSERVESFMQWWFGRSQTFLRSWFALAILFGGFLAYCGL